MLVPFLLVPDPPRLNVVLEFQCSLCDAWIKMPRREVSEVLWCPSCEGEFPAPWRVTHLARLHGPRPQHPVFGELVPSGRTGWEVFLRLHCSNIGELSAKLTFENDPTETESLNYTLLRRRWSEVWAQVESWCLRERAAYGCDDSLNDHSAWLELSLPETAFSDDSDWGVTVMFEPSYGSWCATFVGWNLNEGESQPVF